MKIISVILTFFFLLSLSGWSQQQQVIKTIQAGNDYYKQQQFDQAAAQYNKALQIDPSSLTAKFNLANTLYKQDKPDEGAKLFSEITGNTKETDLRSKSYYNKGVILSKQKKLEESIETYKNALRQNPEDKETRENLQKALLELKKKNPPKKKDQKENKKKQDQKKQQQPKMSPKEAEQRLKLLEQKEKEVQQRLQKERAKSGGGQGKDW